MKYCFIFHDYKSSSMPTQPQTRNLGVLLIFLVIVLMIFIFINYKVEKNLEELKQPVIEIADTSDMCLKGTQSNRARFCPELIRRGQHAVRVLKTNCQSNDEFKIRYINETYNCKQVDKIISQTRKFILALK